MSEIGLQSSVPQSGLRALQTVLHSKWAFWFFLSWPAWPLVFDLVPQELYFAETMKDTGVLSGQLLVATLAITPVTLALKRWDWGRAVSRWLLPRRRYLGVASAGYAILHTAHYIRYEQDVEHILLEALDVQYLVGWIAVVIFIPLAATSNSWSIRTLDRNWKTLQRFSYLAAGAAFLHWFLFDQRPEDFYLWGALLLVAKIAHVLFRYTAGPNRSS